MSATPAALDVLRAAAAGAGGAVGAGGAAGAAGADAIRPAGVGDAIAGVPAQYVATPVSTAQAAAVLAAAAELDLAVVVRGAGTKLDWAAPPRRLDLVLDTTRLTGVVDHAAGDLVVVVQAGTALADLPAALAPAGQQLALDVPLAGATVGGTVAVNTSGPRRMLYGTARDLLIGVTVVRADGQVARAGGKVVKNVAGYDLGKLVTGSYGTLGLITECVFRLHPMPAAAALVRCRVAGPEQAGRLVAAVLGAQVVPTAVEVDLPADDTGVEVAVLLEGVPAGVTERAAATHRLLGGDATIRHLPRGQPSGPGSTGVKPPAPGTVGPQQRTDLGKSGTVLTAAGARISSTEPAPAGSEGAGTATSGGTASTAASPAASGAGSATAGSLTAEPAGGRLTGAGSAGLAPAAKPATAADQALPAPEPASAADLALPAWWAAYPWRTGGVGIKLTAALSGVPGLLAAAITARDRYGVPLAVRGSAGTGVLYAGLPATTDPAAVAGVLADLRAAAAAAGGHAVVLTAPAAVRTGLDLWGPVPGLELMRRVKTQFDPSGRLAPGRFAGGI